MFQPWSEGRGVSCKNRAKYEETIKLGTDVARLEIIKYAVLSGKPLEW